MRKRIFVYFSMFLLLFAFGCKKQTVSPEITEEILLETVSATPVITNIPAPAATPAPTPAPEVSSIIPTYTPEITFVPLPTSLKTPDKRGNTPSPTPEWASPIPSPSDANDVRIYNSVKLAVITKDNTPVRKKAKAGGTAWGNVSSGEKYKYLGDSKGMVSIMYNGEPGYILPDECEITQVDLKQTDVIHYRVGTLNIHSMTSIKKISVLKEFIQEANADIIGLQEVLTGSSSGSYRNSIFELCSQCGYPYYSFCQTLSLDSGLYGTAIISKYPIIDTQKWKLEVARGKESRALAYACILMDNGPVYAFNTHLCASTMHLKSINIASFAYTLKKTGVKTFTVTGDFNCSPPRIHRYIKDVYYANIAENTFGDGSRPKLIDNILYSDGIVVPRLDIYDTDETGITDHKFLVADCFAEKID